MARKKNIKVYSNRVFGGEPVVGRLIRITGDVATIRVKGKTEHHILAVLKVGLEDYVKLLKGKQ